MRNYIIALTPLRPPLRRIVAGVWSAHMSLTNVEQAIIGQHGYNAAQFTPCVEYSLTDSVFNVYYIDRLTAVVTVLSFLTTAAAVDAAVNSYTIEDGLLLVNVTNSTGSKDFYYYIRLEGVNRKLWFSTTNNINFTDQPPAWPFLLTDNLGLDETLSSLKNINLTTSNLSFTLANPEMEDGIRFFANIAQGNNQTVHVPLDDPALIDARLSFYEGAGTSDELLLSPLDPGTVYALIFLSSLRTPPQTYAVVERPEVRLGAEEVLTNVEDATHVLDRVDIGHSLTPSNGALVPRHYGLRVVKGWISDAHNLQEPGRIQMVMCKIAEGPLRGVNWIRINGSDPIPVGVNTAGVGIYADLATGWLMIPRAYIEAHSIDGTFTQDVIEAEIAGSMSSYLEPVDMLERLALLWAKVGLWTAYSGGTVLGNVFTHSGGGTIFAREQSLSQNDLLIWPGDAMALRLRFRYNRSAAVTPVLDIGFNDVYSPRNVISVTLPITHNNWVDFTVLLHPDHLGPVDTGDPEVTVTVKFDVLKTSPLSRLHLQISGMAAVETLEISDIELYRCATLDTADVVEHDVVMGSGFTINNRIPDGQLISQSLDTVRKPDTAVWDPAQHFKGQWSLKLDPFAALVVSLPEAEVDPDREMRLTVFASGLLPDNRMIPLQLSVYDLDALNADPTAAQRRDSLMSMCRIDNCHWSRQAFITKPGQRNFLIVNTPMVFPIKTITGGVIDSVRTTEWGLSSGFALTELLFKSGQQLLLTAFGVNGSPAWESWSGWPEPVFVNEIEWTLPNFTIFNLHTTTLGLTIGPNSLGLSLATPVYIGGIFLHDQFLDVNAVTRDRMEAIAAVGSVDTEISAGALMDQFYQCFGLVPAPARDGRVKLRLLTPSVHSTAAALSENGTVAEWNPESLDEKGDSEGLWSSQVTINAGYSHITETFELFTSASMAEFNLKSPRVPTIRNIDLRWITDLALARSQARRILLQSQQVRAYSIRLVGQRAKSAQAGDMVRISYPPLGINDGYFIIKTVRDNSAGGGEYTDVTVVSLAAFSNFAETLIGDDAIMDGTVYFA